MRAYPRLNPVPRSAVLFHKRLSTCDARPFPNREDLIRFDTLDRVDGTAGPANFQAIGLRRVSQSEVDPNVVLRQIARARFDIPHKNLPRDGKL